MLILGIDIGTTTTKSCVIDGLSSEPIFFNSVDHDAYIKNVPSPKFKQQSCHKLFKSVEKLLSGIPKQLKIKISKIAITGQMHGVLTWTDGVCLYDENSSHFSIDDLNCTDLVTWEDQRCEAQFLESLKNGDEFLDLSSGYGCATLAWYALDDPSKLLKYCGTIHDFVGWVITGSDAVKMSPQNANSWGFFNQSANKFDEICIRRCGLNLDTLPEIVSVGSEIDSLVKSWCGIPKGTSVYAGLGDSLCSCYIVQPKLGDLILNFGTAFQICAIQSQDDCPSGISRKSASGAQTLPFFPPLSLLQGASLNGGNVLAFWVDVLTNFAGDINTTVTTSNDIWDYLLRKCGELQENPGETSLQMDCRLFGERTTPNHKQIDITGINHSNLSIPHLFLSAIRGLLTNLNGFGVDNSDPNEHGNDRRIWLLGLRKNCEDVFAKEVAKIWSGRRVCFPAHSEVPSAAYGAALSLVQ